MESSQDNVSSDDVQFWESIFVVAKIIMCGLLFAVTLTCAVVVKLCVIVITANIFQSFPVDNDNNTMQDTSLKTLNGALRYQSHETNIQWIWALVVMSGSPYFFASIKSLWRLLFQGSGRASPDWSIIFMVTFVM